MRKKDFDSIMRGLADAVAYVRGEPNGCVVHTPEEIKTRRGIKDETE